MIARDGRQISAIVHRRSVDDMRRSSSDRCQSHILVENRDFCPHWNIAITYGMEKPEWCGYPAVKIVFEDLFIRFDKIIIIIIRQPIRRCNMSIKSLQGRRVRRTDGQTDTARRYRPCFCIASRSKNPMSFCIIIILWFDGTMTQRIKQYKAKV